MHQLRTLGRVAAWLVVAALPVAARAAEEWPHWLGPKGDNTVRDAGLLDKWPDAGPKNVWEAPVGLGYASTVGQDGRVYVFSLDGKDTETLAALDAETGRVVWKQGYDRPAPGGERPDRGYEGTRATPAIDGGKIFTFGGTGMLVGRNLADGKELWRLDTLKETGGALLGSGQIWGQASSPLVFGDAVYVQGGRGGAVAVAADKNTGKVRWKSQATGTAGYAAPLLADLPGKPQLVVFGGDAIWGLDPATGKTLWTTPWKASYDINASTPIYHDGKVFVTTGYVPQTGRCALFEISAAGAKKVWEKTAREGGIASRFQPAVLDAGYVYGNSEDKRGTIRCLEWATGKTMWEAGEPHLGFGGSILRVNNDKLIALSQDGKLSLLLATPQKVEVLSQFELFTGDQQVWATPLVYRGKLYAKGKDRLVCLDVSKK